MAKRSSWQLAGVLVALVIALVFMARSFLNTDVGASDDFGITAVDEAPSEARADAPAPPALTAIPTATSSAPTIAESSARESESKGDRAAAATLAELELAEALWVTGRVDFPEHTPIGETVEVVANGRKFKHREMHRAPVASDGSFRVAFAKDTKSGRLTVDAPHLFVRAPLVIKPAQAPSGHVLEPELGGRFLGVVIVPDGVSDAAKELEDASVGLFSWDSGFSETVQRSAKIGADRRFELRGIPTNANCQIHCDTKSWTRVSIDEASVEAGADSTIELRFKRGVHLKGRVVDEAGQPVPSASLTMQIERPDEDGGDSGDMKSTGKDGTFDLPGTETGKITLTGQKTGFLDAKLELGALAEGDLREGIELRMPSGFFVAGHVVWPDGKPAVKALVSADPVQEDDDESWFPGQDQQIKTGEDGSFKISGLKAGAVNLKVHATAREESKSADSGSASEEAEAPKKSLRKAKWTAKLENVMPGDAAVQLTLQPGYSVSGRVVDDAGAPVKRFTVVASAAELMDGPSSTILNTVTARPSGGDGDFTLEGLEAGAWEVVVNAKGYTVNDSAAVVVPDSSTVGTLVVSRASVFRGVVLAPNGTPLARAQVQVSQSKDEQMHMFRMGGDTTRSDSKGKFEIKAGPSGDCTLIASHDDYADSEPLSVSVALGETLENLTLTLRGGGRLSIQLMSSSGAKVANRRISLYGRSERPDWKNVRTNASGQATVDGLSPGEWHVTAEPSEEEVKALGEGADEDDWELRSSLQKTAMVTIVDGETAHLVLGAPPRAPVEVSGVVRSGGSPIAGARVQASLQGEGSSNKFARCDSKGAYRMTLDQPGRYSFTANPEGVQSTRWITVDVPESPAFTFDIELPTGSISGRVLGPDGSPLAEAWVQLSADPQIDDFRTGHVGGWSQPDENGAFRFDHLAAGSYTITASAQPEMEFSAFGRSRGTASAPMTREAVRGLKLAEGGKIQGVEIRLSVGGTLKGIVRDVHGQPTQGAFVTLREASGRPRDDLMATTDGNGKYEITGIGAGAWTVRAMNDGQISNEISAHIVAKETTQADLDLRQGTQLTIEVFERDGKPVGAAISVRDALDRESTAWREGGGTDSGPLKLGPLAAGEYTITAKNHDGNEAKTTITLSGEATRTVSLTLGG